MVKKEPEITVDKPEFTKDGVNIKISSALAKYLGIKKTTKEIYLIPTNGVLQLSAGLPISTIPTLIDLDFEEQSILDVQDNIIKPEDF